MKKILANGLLIGIVNLIVGIIFNQVSNSVFPGLAQEYQTSGIFRPWTDPLMMAFFLYPFILGLALAYFWSIFGKHFAGKTPVESALRFTKIYLLIATIPGMFISYTSFKISLLMTLSWTVAGILEAFVAGWILAKRMK